MDKARQYIVFLLVMAGCGGMLFDFGGTVVNMMVACFDSDVFLRSVKWCGSVPVALMLAGFAVLHFITAALFLPETEGRALEEIENIWEKK